MFPEVLDEDRNLERKADMFSKRTINQEKRIDHVDASRWKPWRCPLGNGPGLTFPLWRRY